MKKIYIILFIIIFSIGFKAGDYDSDGRYKYLPKKIKYFFNDLFSKNKKKPVARVALLTGCVQKVISPQINEATIRLLNRHNIEVVISKKVECCGSLNHHLGKEQSAHLTLKINISTWYDEYLKNGLDAII